MYIVGDFEIFSEDTNYNVSICASKDSELLAIPASIYWKCIAVKNKKYNDHFDIRKSKWSKIYVYELQIRSMIAGVFVSLMSALIVSMVTLF